jgi:hypothetical protein
MSQSLIKTITTLTNTSPLAKKWYVGIFINSPDPKVGQCGLYSFYSIHDSQETAELTARQLNETQGHELVSFRARPCAKFVEFDEKTTTIYHSNDPNYEATNRLIEAHTISQQKAEERKVALETNLSMQAEPGSPAHISQLIYDAQYNANNSSSYKNQINTMDAIVKQKISELNRFFAEDSVRKVTWREYIKPILTNHDTLLTFENMDAWFSSVFTTESSE